MQNTTNLTNITANNISVNNYNVNIHTTNVQQPTQTNILNNEHLTKKCSTLDEKQTTEIVSQILKNIKEVDNNNEQIQQQQQIIIFILIHLIFHHQMINKIQ